MADGGGFGCAMEASGWVGRAQPQRSRGEGDKEAKNEWNQLSSSQLGPTGPMAISLFKGNTGGAQPG